MRSLPFYPLMVLLLIGLGGYLGCDPHTVVTQLDRVVDDGRGIQTAPEYLATIPDRTATTVMIGSFNVKRLGPSKLSKPDIMEQLAAIIRRFDVIAIQEITSVDQRTLPTLVDLVNRTGVNYSYTISPRIGRDATGYFEQYAFVYDASRIAGGPEYSYVVQDPRDTLHREPFVGRFRTLHPNQPFSFSLINIHTDPGEVSEELAVLSTVYKNVREFEYPEDDVVLLGDLNADPKQFGPLGTIPDFIPLIVGIPTNTRMNRTIDNIMIDRQSTREFTGRAGTIDMAQMFQLDLAGVEQISDHLPVWAEFTATEFTPGITATAGADAGVLR